jgi:DNA ligase-1
MFDMVDAGSFKRGIDPEPAHVRKQRLHDAVVAVAAKYPDTKLKSVPVDYIGGDVNQIPKWLKHHCDAGHEGVMLNIADAPYECKRGKNILKVKEFYTADVLVVDLEEGTGANRGKLGAVIIEFIAPDGKTYKCRVGSGFKLDERVKYWDNPDEINGKIIEIAYFELSRNQRDDGYSMRFPTFKRPRPDKTEISMNG